jgi:hypothetical protein
MGNDKNNQPEKNYEHFQDKTGSGELGKLSQYFSAVVSAVCTVSCAFNLASGDLAGATRDLFLASGFGTIYRAEKKNPDLERYKLSRIGDALLTPGFLLTAMQTENKTIRTLASIGIVCSVAGTLISNHLYKKEKAAQDNNGPKPQS